MRTKTGIDRRLTIANLFLQVCPPKSNLVPKDTTCDSEFILEMAEDLCETT